MKALINRTSSPVFVPFACEISVENIDEARLLWHQLSASWVEVAGGADMGVEGCKLPAVGTAKDMTSCTEAFHVLDDYMATYGLKQ